MKVLITGGTGFIGRHAVRAFLDHAHTVRVLCRRTSNRNGFDGLGVEMLTGDLADTPSLKAAVSGTEVVVNIAATMGGAPEEFKAATIVGTRELFAAAIAAGVRRIVHVSSIAVLPVRTPAGAKEIAEDSPHETHRAFLSRYVLAKQESEMIALSYDGKNGVKVLVLRPGLVFGPGGTWKLPRLGYPVGRSFVIIGSGKNLLPVTYVKNLADALLLAAENEEVPAGAYNIIEDDRITQLDYLQRFRREVRPDLRIWRAPFWLVRLIAWAAGVASRITDIPSPFQLGHIVGSAYESTYSTRKAKSQLGWQPRYNGDQAMSETMRFFSKKQTVSRRSDVQLLGSVDPALPRVKVALVGCGVIAETHTEFLCTMPNVRVVACCDVDIDRAKTLAARRGIPSAYNSFEVMLEKEQPHAVHILTPPQLNATLALKAIERGCHVLIEKPMAINLAEAKTMVEAAAARGVKLCVDHNHLYDVVMVQARRLIESSALGDIIWVDSYYGFDLGHNRSNRLMLPGGGRNWTFELPGGLFQNLLPHPLSVALDVLGEPQRISAHARFFRVLPHQPADELRVLLETPRATGLVTVSLAASPTFHTLTLYGTQGTLRVDFPNKILTPLIHQRHVPKAVSRLAMNLGSGWKLIRGTLSMASKVARKKWVHFDGMGTLIGEFHAAIQEDRPTPVTTQDALRLMRVMDTTWEQIGRQNLFTTK